VKSDRRGFIESLVEIGDRLAEDPLSEEWRIDGASPAGPLECIQDFELVLGIMPGILPTQDLSIGESEAI
jgi:hypothetical protein